MCSAGFSGLKSIKRRAIEIIAPLGDLAITETQNTRVRDSHILTVGRREIVNTLSEDHISTLGVVEDSPTHDWHLIRELLHEALHRGFADDRRAAHV